MNNFFIFSFTYENSSQVKVESITVIFCPDEDIDHNILQSEIDIFFQEYPQPDYVYVIFGEYIEKSHIDNFINNQEFIFKRIPKISNTYFKDNINILVFDFEGVLKKISGNLPTKTLLKRILREGCVQIFLKNGGLVYSQSTHHFVFPSGKHSDKFLRTGNILLHNCEILFISFVILKHMNEEINRIFCDTSSINSLGFAVNELRRRFKKADFQFIKINSFSSYDGIEKSDTIYTPNDLILISASTSGNIVQRIIEKTKSRVKEDQIKLLFYLGLNKSKPHNDSNIICDLIHDSIENPKGIKPYKTYNNEIECEDCQKGSAPIQVRGDVFLLEKPKINSILINVTDAPDGLSDFVEEYICTEKEKNQVIKCFFKESTTSDDAYEIFIEMNQVLNEIKSVKCEKYKRFKEKIDKYIQQFVPFTTKFIIYPPDESSKKLAEIVFERLKSKLKKDHLPILVEQSDIISKLNDVAGTAVVITSSLVRARNLLFISRALREYPSLSIIYMIGLVRTSNNNNFEFIKKNLGQGKYKIQTNPIYHIEEFYCSDTIKNTSWHQELRLLVKLIDLYEEIPEYGEVIKYFEGRINILNTAKENTVKGLANNIFLIDPFNEKELCLGKNFAFLKFESYHDHISQSEVYFIISSVLNNLRTVDITKNKNALINTEYLRTVIHPNNFYRFNEGIIQSAIIRAAKNSELIYDVDENLSKSMRDVILSMLKHPSQGDGLLEIMFALALNKMKINNSHLNEIIEEIMKSKNQFLKIFAQYIKDESLKVS